MDSCINSIWRNKPALGCAVCLPLMGLGWARAQGFGLMLLYLRWGRQPCLSHEINTCSIPFSALMPPQSRPQGARLGISQVPVMGMNIVPWEPLVQDAVGTLAQG